MKYLFEMICIRKEVGAVLLQGEAAQLEWDTDSFMFTAEQIKKHKGTGKGGKGETQCDMEAKGQVATENSEFIIKFPFMSLLRGKKYGGKPPFNTYCIIFFLSGRSWYHMKY